MMTGRQVTMGALRSYYPHGRFASRLTPLPSLGLIYVRNAKVATGTTLLWLHRIHTGDYDFVPQTNIHVEHALPRPTDVGWDTVVRMLNGAAFRFSFVRDPVRRVESAYRDKVVRHRSYSGRADLQRTLGLPVDPRRDLSFDQFVAALTILAEDPLTMDPHWRPQHLNLMHPLIHYDYVGRLETYAADLARIREASGLPDLPIPQLYVSDKPPARLLDGRPGLLRTVRTIYAADFELFGYSVPY